MNDENGTLNTDNGLEMTESPRKPSRKQHKKDISWGLIALIFAALIGIRLFIAEPFLVYGSSMEPNFETGDYLIVDELSYKVGVPKRGDVVVLVPPNEPTKHFIKRIIGLPGETVDVKGNVVTITNKEHPEGIVLSEPYVTFQSDRVAHMSLKSDEYFVMGDNRTVSFDSRSWGPLPAKNITGKAFLRLYPFSGISVEPGSTGEYGK
jgi:signal peptidase I